MGLKSKLRDLVKARILSGLGKDFSVSKWGLKMLKFKGPIGAAFLALWGFAEYNQCSGLFSFVTQWVSCEILQDALGLIGALGVGAGWFKSDSFHKRKAEDAKFSQ